MKIRNKQSLWFICLVSTQMGMEKRNVNHRVRNENHSTVLITWWQTRNPSGNTTSNGFINPPIKNPPFCKVKSIIYVCARLCLCVCVCVHKGFSSLIRNSLHVFLNSVLITPTPRNFKQLDKLPTYTLRGALTVVRFSPRASHPVGKHDTHMHG